MKHTIALIALGVLLFSHNGIINAQDVSIDASGNVVTGTSNSGANLEVIGSSGEDGVVGSTTGTGASGVYGIHTGSGNYGTLGNENYGVYGSGSTAGHFQGNVTITGNLDLGGSLLNFTESDPTVNTLGKSSGLSGCAEGEIPKVVGGSWSCSADVDTDTNTQISEGTVEAYITNGPIDLDPGSTIGGVAIADVNDIGGGGGYGGVAIVAKSGGDYTDPVAAMAVVSTWCGGVPSATNPCLIKIMPGEYTVGSSLVMQSYVDIEGSGENVTKIKGAVSNSDPFVITTGLVFGSDNAEIRNLTIENAVSGPQTVAMINNGVSPKITNVTMIPLLGSVNTGLYNNASDAVIREVTIDALGGVAMWNDGACNLEIYASSLKGGGNSISAAPGARTAVSGSKLDGLVSAPANIVKCFGSFDATLTAVACP